MKETVGEQGNEENGDEDGEKDVLYAVRFHEVMLQAFRLRWASRFSRAKEAEMRIVVGGELGVIHFAQDDREKARVYNPITESDASRIISGGASGRRRNGRLF